MSKYSRTTFSHEPQLHRMNAEIASKVSEQATAFYAQARANHQLIASIADPLQQSQLWGQVQPQMANVIAGAYADIITTVLQRLTGEPCTYAATSNAASNSRTSAISLFTKDGTTLPSVDEFEDAISRMDLRTLKNTQLQRMFIDDTRRQAMLDPLNRQWPQHESLVHYRTPNQANEMSR